MRIGIDIDDTINDTWDYLIPICSKLYKISKTDLQKSIPYYQALKEKISLDEYYDFMQKYHNENSLRVPIKKDATRVINDLHNQGHQIIFISDRVKGYTNPYEITKKYLDKHHIHYDKIIVDSTDKDEVCQKEKIDLFIDNSIKHCTNVKNKGIEVLMYNAPYNEKEKEFIHVKSWKEIEEYIQSRWYNDW